MKEEELLLPVSPEAETDARISVRLLEPAGAEKALLYFHGFGSDQRGEKGEFFCRRAAESGLAVCSFDFRGHGRSEGTLRTLTLSRNLEDAAAARQFLEARGYEDVILFGSSMGGITALWHGQRQPAGVRALCCVAPAVTLADGFLSFLEPEQARQWERDGVFLFDDGERAAELGWELVSDFRSFELDQLRSGLPAPTLLFQGQRDDRVPWQVVRDFAAGRPDFIELELFADGDHRLADRKEELWRRLTDFLSRRAG